MTRDTIAFDTLETVAVDAARTFTRLAKAAEARGDAESAKTFSEHATTLWKTVYRRRYGR